MKTSHGLQHWLESKAAGPAFLIAAASVVLRGAAFWSGGAINLAAILGHTGVAWFNGGTGIGIAVGSELLASVFGRQWRRMQAERVEAAGRRGLHKAERAALCAHYAAQETIAKRYMLLGVAASLVASAFFLVTTTGAHGPAQIAAEVVIAGVLVAVMTGFGVFYEDRPDADAAELAQGQARTMRARAVEAAAARVASGDYTPQDVRLSGSALPRAERDSYESALIVATPDDPMWSTAQLAEWLGCNDQAGRRSLQRKLVKLKESGAGVVKDDRTGYAIPRSVVAMHFADAYLASHAPVKRPSPAGLADLAAARAARTTPDAGTTATSGRATHDHLPDTAELVTLTLA